MRKNEQANIERAQQAEERASFKRAKEVESTKALYEQAEDAKVRYEGLAIEKRNVEK